MEPSNKRMRESQATEEDIMHDARLIMHEDPFKEFAPSTEERKFRALFGAGVAAVLELWLLLVSHDCVPPGGTIMFMLWTLMFVKVYPTDKTLRKLCGGASEKTIRRWVQLYASAIGWIEGEVVS